MRDPKLISYARENRSVMNDAERRIWYHLRHRAQGVRFRRQHPIGSYIADFASVEIGLVIDLDGSQHRDPAYDERRDEYMRSRGWKVLRFWSWDVIGNLEGVLNAIADSVVPPVKGGPAERSSVEGG